MGVVLVVGVVLLVVSIMAGLHWYVWRRLVGDTTARGTLVRRLGTATLIVLPLLAIGAPVSERVGAPFWLQRVIVWPGFLWMALFLYLLLALLVGEAIRPLLRLAAKKPAAPVGAPRAEAGDVLEAPVSVPDVEDQSRRLFVARSVAVAATVVAAGTVGYGTYGVMRGPQVKRVVVPLARLPRSAHGLRIALVGDIHLSAVLGRAHAQRVTDAINATQPDLIAVVGDLVDGDVDDLAYAAEPLAGLRSRQGTYFVTGNHEYFSGARQWIDHVRELGMRPLENERVSLEGFDLAGVNDLAGEPEGEGPDFAKALGDRDRSRATILLAHQPVVVHDAREHGVDLQLSGHTHGGQLWPGQYVAALANPTVAGLDRFGDTQLYVTRGAGAWGPPTRIGAPSDITVIELASIRT